MLPSLLRLRFQPTYSAGGPIFFQPSCQRTNHRQWEIEVYGMESNGGGFASSSTLVMPPVRKLKGCQSAHGREGPLVVRPSPPIADPGGTPPQSALSRLTPGAGRPCVPVRCRTALQPARTFGSATALCVDLIGKRELGLGCAPE